LDFLAERLGAVSREDWQARMQRGDVLSEHGQALGPHTPYATLARQQPQARVYYYRALEAEAPIPFEAQVVFEDEHLLVADKPHFLPVVPSGRFVRETLLVRLKAHTGLENLSPIHRIDRETAGLVVFSKRAQDRRAYQQLFVTQDVHKTYLAVAPWRAHLQHPVDTPLIHRSRMATDTQFFRQREVTGTPNSETHVAMLDHWQTSGHLALYQLTPRSGKTHQLRVHMNALGAPISGDQLYPEVKHAAGVDNFSHPLQLLAKSMAFTDPVTGQARLFDSQRLLNQQPQLKRRRSD
jgi:tRNA pseudouridine32 synthase/23S rRNA pseudouridine746 synthase